MFSTSLIPPVVYGLPSMDWASLAVISAILVGIVVMASGLALVVGSRRAVPQAVRTVRGRLGLMDQGRR